MQETTINCAPGPWTIETSTTPGGNGTRNLYINDRNGRKIAAVWGKEGGEKETTAAIMIAAPELLKLLKEFMSVTDPLFSYNFKSFLVVREKASALIKKIERK